MTPGDLALILTGFAAVLSLAGFVAWLVTVLPPDPLGADAERRYQASERHVRRVGR
jgi:hypothetical protein